jgi:hypothetical protein
VGHYPRTLRTGLTLRDVDRTIDYRFSYEIRKRLIKFRGTPKFRISL